MQGGRITRWALASALAAGATLGSPMLVAHAGSFTSTVTSGRLNQGTTSSGLSNLYGGSSGSSTGTQLSGQGTSGQSGGIPGTTSGLLNQGTGSNLLGGSQGSLSTGTTSTGSGTLVPTYPSVTSSGGVTTGRFSTVPGTSTLFPSGSTGLPAPSGQSGSTSVQGGGQPSPASGGGVSGSGSAQSEAQQVLAMVNAQRQQVDVQPLALDAALSQLAQERAQAMAAHNVVTHDVPGYGYADAMETAAGISGKLLGGEDIATGLTVDEAFWNLVTSPWHYANMVFASYNTAGVGIATMPNGSVVLDLLFIER